MTLTLDTYLQETQDKATTVCAWLRGLESLTDDLDSERVEFCAIRAHLKAVIKKAQELNNALDSLNLPEVEGLPVVTKTASSPPLNFDAFDQLVAAISILQSNYLSRDTAMNAKEMFGSSYMPDATIEHAIKLLTELMPVVNPTEGGST